MKFSSSFFLSITLLTFMLNCVDLMASVFLQSLGTIFVNGYIIMIYEANPLLIQLWQLIGVSGSILLKLTYPFMVLGLVQFTFWYCSSHSSLREQSQVNLIFGVAMVFGVVFPLAGVLSNVDVLLKLGGLLH